MRLNLVIVPAAMSRSVELSERLGLTRMSTVVMTTARSESPDGD